MRESASESGGKTNKMLEGGPQKTSVLYRTISNAVNLVSFL